MIKHVKYDFYQVLMPRDSRFDFQTVLTNIDALDWRRRLDESGDHPIRLHYLEPRDAIILGDVAKIRMSDLPDKMKKTGETNDLELDEDEGLGELASFIYHPHTSIIVYMRNRNSVSISAFNNYIQNIAHVHGIQFVPIMHEDAYRRIARLVKIQRLDIEVAAPGNGTIFRDLGLSPEGNADLMTASPRVRMAIGFSTGHEKERSLPARAINQLIARVRDIVQPGQTDVSLVVSGRDEILEKEVIDLFEDMLTDYSDINLRNQRKITDAQRHNAISAVWGAHRERLIRDFAPRDN